MTQTPPIRKTTILPSVTAPQRSLQATSLTMEPHFEAVGICDTGVSRKDNQDAFQLRIESIGPGREILAAVADGMGGLSQGRFASRLALQIFCESFQREGGQPAPKAMRRAMEEANQALSQAGQKLHFPRMGTTFTAICLEGRRITLAHIGDSRAYRIRAGAVEQLTTDHSRAGELARMRLITPAAVRTHDQRSILTRALGMDLMVQPEIRGSEAEAGDVFLLCSDGVWSALDDSTLPALLAGAATLTEFARSVVECALEDGSDDNVCAVVLRVGERPAGEAPAPTGRLRRLWARLRPTPLL
jgi:serine/threonine protein phosphatase PrpC